MANLLSWGFDRLKGGAQTVNRDVLHPVEHAAGNVIHAGGNVVHAVEAAPTVVNRDVVQPILNTPQTFRNDVVAPVQRDVVRPLFNAPQTINNDLFHPIQRIPLGNGVTAGGFVSSLPRANADFWKAAPLAAVRAGEGLVQGVVDTPAFVYNTADTIANKVTGNKGIQLPGQSAVNTATNYVNKPFNYLGRETDKAAQNLGLNMTAYHAAQVPANIAATLINPKSVVNDVKKAAVVAERGAKAATPTATLHHTLLEKNPSYAALQERLDGSTAAANKINQTGGSKVALSQHLKNIDNIQQQMAEMRRKASTTGSLNPDYSSITPEGSSLPKRTSVNPRLPKTQSSANKEILNASSKNSVAPEGHGQTFYHGTDTPFNVEDIKPGTKRTVVVSAFGNTTKQQFGNDVGFSITRDKTRAADYGKHVIEVGIKPGAKIATAKDLPQVFKKFDDGLYFNQTDAVKAAKAAGFDGIDLHDFEMQTPKPTKNQEIQIFNPNVIEKVPVRGRTGSSGRGLTQELPVPQEKAYNIPQVAAESKVAPQPTRAAKASAKIILKETKPRGGRQDVITAQRNPATGKLEIRQESIIAPKAAQLADHAPMSDAELASLESQTPLPDRLGLTQEPHPIGTGLSDAAKSVSRTAPEGSLAHDTPNLLDEIKGHPSYPVEKKVGLLDYLRTPERVLNKIGLGKEAQALRAADHAYKAELPKQIEQIKKWHTEVGNSPEVSQRIFQYLDGQKVRLSPIEQNVANQMKSTLKGWADRLGIPEEHRITNYITHIFDESLVGKEFDPELEKLIADRVPGSVYDPYTQQRLGAKGYVEDAFRAMEAYTKRAVRKANFDPALEKLSSAAEGLDLSGWNYVKHYGDRINMRPTMIDNLLDNSIKQSPIGYKFGNRPTAAISRAIRQATYRASLGLNVGSAVRNLTQGINTFAELGTKWTGVGYTKALQAIARGSQELKDTGVLDNSFVEDRTISVAKQALQKVDKGLFSFFEAAEKVNRGAAYFGAKAKALHEGKSLEQAVQAGVAAARKTQFTFGRVDTPVALQDDLTKLLTQFQSYNVKQAEFLGEMIKNKEFAKLLRFTGASAVVFLTVGRALGYRPTDMLPSAQIGGAPPFKVPAATGQAIVKIFTAKDSKNSTRGQQVQKAWMNAGSKLGSATIPGFTQGKKTVTGINAVNREQVKKGSTNYTIQPSTGNFIKGAVFGPYSLNGPKSTPSVSIGSGSGAVKLTPIQSDAFNKQNGAAYQQLVARLHQTAGYKVATPTQQKKMDTTLKAQVTSAMKRQYSANNNIGSGLAKPPKSSDTSILSGSLPPQSAKGGGVKIAPNLDKNSTNVLTKYASTTARAKWFNSQDDAQYQYDLAKYNNDKANGTLTVAQDIQTQTKLAKEQVGSTYSKNVRDLYTLSKTELYNYLTKPEKGVNKGQIADQLLAYDQALYNAGLEKSLKFKTGIAPSSGGSGGRSSKYDKVATANLKFALAQKPLKIVGALPAPSKATGPKFITPALKTVYQKKAVNTHPTVSVTKTKHP